MLDAILQSLNDLLTLNHVAHLVMGVLLGLVIGIFPGLGGIAGLSMLLPFLYGMDTASALATLIGLVAVIPTSATFTSILMGIPGSSSSQATVLDGFPLAKKGQASRALGAAFMSSLFGGLFGALILTFFVQIARPVILVFGSAELFMLAIFGLTMVGSLSGRSLAKGIFSCGLGMLIGAIGSAPATGEFRLIFGIDYLYDGIPLVVVALGIFALPEIADLLRKDGSISQKSDLGTGLQQGFRDVMKHRWLALRCSGLGTLIGAIPGMGGSVVDWIAYGHGVQSTRDKSKFGKGDIRGVIAPESANNAKEGGALVPTLLFGIPGSGSMAIFLGGMVLIGIEAGPSMVTTELNLTYIVIWSLAIANLLGAGMALFLARPMAKLTSIRFSLLAPFMIMVISFAAYQATRDMMDLWMLLLCGILGMLMRRFGWSRPSFLIGFVLSQQAESYLNMAVQFYGWEMFLRPGVIAIIIVSTLSLYLSRKGVVDEHAEQTSEWQPNEASIRAQKWFALFLVSVAGISIFEAFRQSFLGGVFPLAIAFAILPSGFWILWNLWRDERKNPIVFDAEARIGSLPNQSSVFEGALWIAGLFTASSLIGFLPATALFFISILAIKARVSRLKNATLTASGLGFLLVFAHFLNLDYPMGILLEPLLE